MAVDSKLQAPNSLRVDNPSYSGLEHGKLVSVVPESAMVYFKGSRATMLHTGHERFNIFCAPCHGRLGDGQGMIAKRGFNIVRKPASYHTDRLRNLPDGHIFDVMTNGFGTMYSYASRTTPEERWAIVAYVRALQLSQNAKVTDVPQDKLGDLEKPLSTFEEHAEEEEAHK